MEVIGDMETSDNATTLKQHKLTFTTIVYFQNDIA